MMRKSLTPQESPERASDSVCRPRRSRLSGAREHHLDPCLSTIII